MLREVNLFLFIIQNSQKEVKNIFSRHFTTGSVSSFEAVFLWFARLGTVLPPARCALSSRRRPGCSLLSRFSCPRVL